jgi:hypothetical protein
LRFILWKLELFIARSAGVHEPKNIDHSMQG